MTYFVNRHPWGGGVDLLYSRHVKRSRSADVLSSSAMLAPNLRNMPKLSMRLQDCQCQCLPFLTKQLTISQPVKTCSDGRIEHNCMQAVIRSAALCGRGECIKLKIMKAYPEFIGTFHNLRASIALDDDTSVDLETFTCLLYNMALRPMDVYEQSPS